MEALIAAAVLGFAALTALARDNVLSAASLTLTGLSVAAYAYVLGAEVAAMVVILVYVVAALTLVAIVAASFVAERPYARAGMGAAAGLSALLLARESHAVGVAAQALSPGVVLGGSALVVLALLAVFEFARS